MLINEPSNRRIISEIAEEYDLDLIDPEIFLRFISIDLYIQTWDDVYRETRYKTENNFVESKLRNQYKFLAFTLKNKGYTDFDNSRF